jgi:hypothetical protein
LSLLCPSDGFRQGHLVFPSEAVQGISSWR